MPHSEKLLSPSQVLADAEQVSKVSFTLYIHLPVRSFEHDLVKYNSEQHAYISRANQDLYLASFLTAVTWTKPESIAGKVGHGFATL